MMQTMQQQTPPEALYKNGHSCRGAAGAGGTDGARSRRREPRAQAEEEFAALIAGKYREAFARRTQGDH